MNGNHDARTTLRRLALPIIVVCGLGLSGCATAHQQLRYGDLETKTELSESVFLDLTTGFAPTVFISVGSTIPDETLNGTEIHVRPTLDRTLRGLGYTIVDDPNEATYIIQLNHRSLVEFELGELELGDALGSAIASGAVAAWVAEEIVDIDAGEEIGLAVGILGFILDSRTKHIAHALTTDVLITETVAIYDEEPERRYHETQIVNGASKVNLKSRESLPAMIRQLCGALGGMLPSRPTR